jgi:hypothetical protein
VQIFHEAIDSSYLAVSDQRFSGVQKLPGSDAHQNPRDHNWQVMRALDTVAQDANYSFLRGAYQKPADATAQALRTRGLVTATTTNVVAWGGAEAKAISYRNLINEVHRKMVENAGAEIDDGHALFCDSIQFNNVSLAFESKTQAPQDRHVAGVAVRTIYTRFGKLNLVYEPDMPAQTLQVANLAVCGVVGLPVPNKGLVFEEPLAKIGSSDRTQIYAQLGIDHGPEWMHGKITGAPAAALAEAEPVAPAGA